MPIPHVVAKILVVVFLFVEAVGLLFVGTCLLTCLIQWLKDKHEELRMKTYCITFLGFSYNKEIDKDRSMVFPLKDKSHVYVKARSQKKAIGKFYMDHWNFGHFMTDIEEVKA